MQRPDDAVGDDGRRAIHPGQRQRAGQQIFANDDMVRPAGVAHGQRLAQPAGQRRGDVVSDLLGRPAIGGHGAEAGVGGGALLQKGAHAGRRVVTGQQGALGLVGGHTGHDLGRVSRQAQDGAAAPQCGGVVGVEHEPAAGGDDQAALLR